MDSFWLNKAHKYIKEHNAFSCVSEIIFHEISSSATINAEVSVGLPSKFILNGETDLGVKGRESVHFIFSDNFPLEAPEIRLRDDFPRCFPHINPSELFVLPCIYEGNLSELLQQAEWMNGILNQLVDWLEKAASNDLMNSEQGWEPMRNDNLLGFITYNLDQISTTNFNPNDPYLEKEIFYKENNGVIMSDVNNTYKIKVHALLSITPSTINKYLPNQITNLSELYQYATSVGITNLKAKTEELDFKYKTEDKIFIILSIKRPTKLIKSDYNLEVLNFVVHKSKNRKGKKRVLPECQVGILSHIESQSPTLFKKLSGTKTKINKPKNIAILGCGSLGSKIAMHLVRNGNGPFLCIDDDIFMPHNNARHALTFTFFSNKADLLSRSIINISGIKSEPAKESVFKTDFSNSRLIIDTTASLAVRNFLVSQSDLPPVISGGLYGKGRHSLLLIENNSKKTTLVDLWANLYYQSLNNDIVRNLLFTPQIDQTQIGQSCSSQTLVVDDARISLMAATMGLKIQSILEEQLPETGNIMLSSYDDYYSLKTEFITVPQSIHINSVNKNDWQIMLSEPVQKIMKELMYEKKPNETGGVLLGTVFWVAKMISITAILPAPSDSIEKPNYFELGTDGLERNIKFIEKKTNAKVTYLGTWHSHPCGGGASITDKETFKKLSFARNYEPTVCLIITPSGIFHV